MADEVHLMERLGGREVVEEFVYGWYDLMLLDVTLGGFFRRWMAMAPGCSEFQFKRLKDRTVDFLSDAWGRASPRGQGVYAAHASLHISTKMYDLCMACVKTEVKKMGLDKDLAKDVIAAMEAMREPITDPDGKYHKWLLEKHHKKEQDRGHAHRHQPSMAGLVLEPRPSVTASKGSTQATQASRKDATVGDENRFMISKDKLKEMEEVRKRLEELRLQREKAEERQSSGSGTSGETTVSIVESLKAKPVRVLRRGNSTASTACSSDKLVPDYTLREPMHCTHVPACKRVVLLAGPRVVSL